MSEKNEIQVEIFGETVSYPGIFAEFAANVLYRFKLIEYDLKNYLRINYYNDTPAEIIYPELTSMINDIAEASLKEFLDKGFLDLSKSDMLGDSLVELSAAKKKYDAEIRKIQWESQSQYNNYLRRYANEQAKEVRGLSFGILTSSVLSLMTYEMLNDHEIKRQERIAQKNIQSYAADLKKIWIDGNDIPISLALDSFYDSATDAVDTLLSSIVYEHSSRIYGLKGYNREYDDPTYINWRDLDNLKIITDKDTLLKKMLAESPLCEYLYSNFYSMGLLDNENVKKVISALGLHEFIKLTLHCRVLCNIGELQQNIAKNIEKLAIFYHAPVFFKEAIQLCEEGHKRWGEFSYKKDAYLTDITRLYDELLEIPEDYEGKKEDLEKLFNIYDQNKQFDKAIKPLEKLVDLGETQYKEKLLWHKVVFTPGAVQFDAAIEEAEELLKNTSDEETVLLTLLQCYVGKDEFNKVACVYKLLKDRSDSTQSNFKMPERMTSITIKYYGEDALKYLMRKTEGINTYQEMKKSVFPNILEYELHCPMCKSKNIIRKNFLFSKGYMCKDCNLKFKDE